MLKIVMEFLVFPYIFVWTVPFHSNRHGVLRSGRNAARNEAPDELSTLFLQSSEFQEN